MRVAKVQVVFLAMTMLIAAAAGLLAALHHIFLVSPPADAMVLVARWRFGLAPKPGERFVFLTLAVSVPVITLFIANRLFASGPYVTVRSTFRCIMPFAAAMLLVIPFFGFDFNQALFTSKSLPEEHPVLKLFVLLTAAGLWIAFSYRIKKLSKIAKIVGDIAIWVSFIGLMALQIAAWRVSSISSVTRESVWHNSFDAVIYSISQVAAGKTVLLDLPSQYGLFPEMLKPFFSIVPLTVLSLTVVFAVMQVVSLGAVFLVARKSVRRMDVRLLLSIALTMITFETILFVIDIPDPYFQYWPIRFFWPALSLLAFDVYVRRTSIRTAGAVSLIGALGALWNADSGVMIEVAFGAYLVARIACLIRDNDEKSKRIRNHFLTALVVHIVMFVLAVAGSFWWMRSAGVLHYDWLFKYQKIFYAVGFALLPMPLHPYPWMSLLGVYLVGFLASLSTWIRYPKSSSHSTIFYLSVLGLGLFIYYEGRSHPLNLIAVSWPALILAAILSDRVIRAVRCRVLPIDNLSLPIVGVALIAFCAWPILSNVGKLVSASEGVFSAWSQTADPRVADEISFIKRHSHRGEQCLILSLRQGIYHAESGTSSPIIGPGYVETLLFEDQESELKQIRETRPACVFVGVGKDSAIDFGIDTMALFRGYSVAAKSDEGSMLYLNPSDATGLRVHAVEDTGRHPI